MRITGDMGSILDREDLEEETATHFRVLAWKTHGERNLAATVHQAKELAMTE